MEHVTEGTWESLPVPLHPRVLGALRELGFPYMTPVQVPGVARAGGGSPVRSWQCGKAGAGRAGARWMGHRRRVSALGLASWSFRPCSRDFCRAFRLPLR